MAIKKEEISIRQFMMIYILLIGSPVIRLLPVSGAELGHQAGWLAPLVSFIVMLPIIFIFQKMFDKYPCKSFLDITYDVFGKYFGTVLNIIFLIFITMLAALYVRYYADRIVNSIFPNAPYQLFIVILLVLIAVVLRSGVAVFARMVEVFLPMVVFIYLLLTIALFPKIKIDNLLPLTYKDILPVWNSSLSSTGLFGYLTFMLILADRLKSTDKIKKLGFKSIIILLFLMTMTIIPPIGIFGWEVTAKMNLPYFVAIKDISLFEIIQRIESGVITIWVITDFVIITAFSFVCLHTIKWLFKTTTVHSLINMFLIIVFVLSMYIANSSMELMALSSYVFIYIIIILSIIVPLLIFFVGKVRKKI